MSKRVGVSNFSSYASDLIRKYGDFVYDALEDSINEVAKETAQKLKTEDMPFENRTGKYQKDWTWTAIKKRLMFDAIVYNKKNYQLTHLLEFGHAVVRGGRKVGDAGAHEHIKPINDWAQTEVLDRMLDKLSK